MLKNTTAYIPYLRPDMHVYLPYGFGILECKIHSRDKPWEWSKRYTRLSEFCVRYWLEYIKTHDRHEDRKYVKSSHVRAMLRRNYGKGPNRLIDVLRLPGHAVEPVLDFYITLNDARKVSSSMRLGY